MRVSVCVCACVCLCACVHTCVCVRVPVFMRPRASVGVCFHDNFRPLAEFRNHARTHARTHVRTRIIAQTQLFEAVVTDIYRTPRVSASRSLLGDYASTAITTVLVSLVFVSC